MPSILVVLTLAVWVAAIAVLVNVNLTEKSCWLPVLLALAGIFCSILPLAISTSIAVMANGAILISFFASVALLETKHRFNIALIKHRA